MPNYTIQTKIVVYPGTGGWRFISIPKRISKEIKNKFGKRAVAWGSIRVTAKIGKTKWQTSLFPDKKTETYLLPLKAEVRGAEKLVDNVKVTCDINL